jgi:hypothetical protein
MGESIVAEQYDAQRVLDKIEWEGPEGITWFHEEDSIDPEGEDSLYSAVQDARLGWYQYEDAIRRIAKIAEERNEA